MPRQTRGKFIAVEGIDGIGKTTLIKKLINKLVSDGACDAKDICFVNEDPDFKALRRCGNFAKIVMGSGKDSIYVNDMQISLMYLADFYNIKNLLLKKLKKGKHCIIDRYYLSTLVYGGRDSNDEELLHSLIHQLDMDPDAFIILDGDVQNAINCIRYRINKEYHEHNDRHSQAWSPSMEPDIYENEEMLKYCKDRYIYYKNNGRLVDKKLFKINNVKEIKSKILNEVYDYVLPILKGEK